MSIRSWPCVGFVCGIAMLISAGCVARRTVKKDGAVVEQGYVLKGPLPNTMTGF
jgi:hypothetical protein